MNKIYYLIIGLFCMTGCVSKTPSNGFFKYFEFIETNQNSGHIKYEIDKKWLDWSADNESDIYTLHGGSMYGICDGKLIITTTGVITYRVRNEQRGKIISLHGNGSIICNFDPEDSIHKIELMASPNKLPLGDPGEIPIGVNIDFERYKTKINP